MKEEGAGVSIISDSKIEPLGLGSCKYPVSMYSKESVLGFLTCVLSRGTETRIKWPKLQSSKYAVLKHCVT